MVILGTTHLSQSPTEPCRPTSNTCSGFVVALNIEQRMKKGTEPGKVFEKARKNKKHQEGSVLLVLPLRNSSVRHARFLQREIDSYDSIYGHRARHVDKDSAQVTKGDHRFR